MDEAFVHRVDIPKICEKILRNDEEFSNDSGMRYEVIVPALKRVEKLAQITVSPIRLMYKKHDFVFWDDFYNYRGKRNDRADIAEHLAKYKEFIIDEHQFDPVKSSWRQWSYTVYFRHTESCAA